MHKHLFCSSFGRNVALLGVVIVKFAFLLLQLLYTKLEDKTCFSEQVTAEVYFLDNQKSSLDTGNLRNLFFIKQSYIADSCVSFEKISQVLECKSAVCLGFRALNYKSCDNKEFSCKLVELVKALTPWKQPFKFSSHSAAHLVCFLADSLPRFKAACVFTREVLIKPSGVIS